MSEIRVYSSRRTHSVTIIIAGGGTDKAHDLPAHDAAKPTQIQLAHRIGEPMLGAREPYEKEESKNC